MGPIESSIQSKISNHYSVDFLNIENESHKHKAALGLESHFKVILVSKDFQSLSRIARAQALHKLLERELQSIHALSLKLYTPEEWAKVDQNLLLSPKCSG